MLRIDVTIWGSVKTHAKLLMPAKDRVPKPSQFENARMNAKTNGPTMNTTRPTS